MSVQLSASAYYSIASAFDYNSAYTWAAWIKLDSIGDYREVLEVGDSGGSRFDYLEVNNQSPGFLCLIVYDSAGGIDNIPADIPLTPGVWYFVAMRRTSVTLCELFIDSWVAATSTRDVTGRTASGKLWMGAVEGTGLVGATCRHRAWTAALPNTGTDSLAGEKASASAVRQTNKYGFWEMVSAASGTTDTSGNNRTLTATGTPTTGADDPKYVVTNAGNDLASLTIAFDATGYNYIVVDVAAFLYTGVTNVTATYAGQSMTRKTGSPVANDDNILIFEKTAPASGVNNVVITFTGAHADATAGVTGYASIDQGTPSGTTASNSGTDTSPALSVSSVSGDLVHAAVAHSNSIVSLNSGEFGRWVRPTSGGEHGGGFEKTASGSTTSFSFTTEGSGPWWRTAGFALKTSGGGQAPSPGSGGQTIFRMPRRIWG